MEKPKKNSWGGARPNSGRKKNKDIERLRKIAEKIRSHALEEVTITNRITLEKTKKKRILLLLDTLYRVGIKDNNVYAIKEYLDRAIGKSTQYIEASIEDNGIEEVKQELKQLTKINEKGNKNTTKPVQRKRKKRK